MDRWVTAGVQKQYYSRCRTQATLGQKHCHTRTVGCSLCRTRFIGTFVGHSAQFSVEISGNLTVQWAENAGLLARTSDGFHRRDPAGPQLAAATGKTHALHNSVWTGAISGQNMEGHTGYAYSTTGCHDSFSNSQWEATTATTATYNVKKWNTNVAQRQPKYELALINA